MTRYAISYTETTAYAIDVEAETEDEALELAKEKIEDGNFTRVGVVDSFYQFETVLS